MRSISCVITILIGTIGCGPEKAPSDPDPGDCRTCTNPDLPECEECLGDPGTPALDDNPLSAVDPIVVSQPQLDFAIIGDTRPASVNDTAGYPTAVITTIFQDLQSTSPRPGFVVGTGDYQFSSNGSSTTGPQLDLYLQARTGFSNPEYPAMGNHECTGATASNCGPGTKDGATTIYNAYMSKVLAPLGLHDPYYSVNVTPPGNAWSAKIVFVAANAWTSTQATWLDSVLAQPTTYTFVVRHENSSATTAPGVTPSAQIIANHPYTMLITGHTHTYKHVSQKEIIVGNGGAPLTTGSAYGFGIVSQRSDGAIQFAFYNYKTLAVLDKFAVNADGSPASQNPPPGTFTLGASPAAVTSSGTAATSTIALTALSGFSGTATLSISGLPSGAHGTLGTTQLGAGGSTTLTMSPGTASPGSYGINIAGVRGSETEAVGLTWTIAATTCAHDLCTSGVKLNASCDPCASMICAHDSYCCATAWNSICVGEVASVCGQNTCSGGSSCAHDMCSTGGKLASGCDSCVTQICAKDSFCCTTNWDAACVAEVGTICGDTCN